MADTDEVTDFESNWAAGEPSTEQNKDCAYMAVDVG